MKEKKKLIETENLDNKCLLPVNYFLIDGEEIIFNETVGGIVKLVECDKLNSEGYKCFSFYKKISRYL